MTQSATAAAQECISCAIARHEAEASTVHEDETAMASMDRSPVTPGHLLVVPRRHAVGLEDLDAATGGHVRAVAHDMARRRRRQLARPGAGDRLLLRRRRRSRHRPRRARRPATAVAGHPAIRAGAVAFSPQHSPQHRRCHFVDRRRGSSILRHTHLTASSSVTSAWTTLMTTSRPLRCPAPARQPARPRSTSSSGAAPSSHERDRDDLRRTLARGPRSRRGPARDAVRRDRGASVATDGGRAGRHAPPTLAP